MAGWIAGWMDEWMNQWKKEWLSRLATVSWGITSLFMSILQLEKGITKNLTKITEDKGKLVFLSLHSFSFFLIHVITTEYINYLDYSLRNTFCWDSFSSQDVHWYLIRCFPLFFPEITSIPWGTWCFKNLTSLRRKLFQLPRYMFERDVLF